jgi:hypothetical protein
MTGSIYALCDPVTEEIRYVGQTIRTKAKRLYRHMYEAKQRQTHVHRWIMSLASEPLFRVLAVVPRSQLNKAERRWIAKLRQTGARLTNLTDGGEGLKGYVATAETCRKISIAKQGHTVSAAARKKIGDASRGRKASDETRRKMSRSLRNRDVVGSATSNAKLTETQVREIRASSLSQRKLAAMYGVGCSAITSIKLYRTWRHVA